MTELTALPPPEPQAEAPPEPPAPRRAVLPWLTGAGFLLLAAAMVWVWRHPTVPSAPTEQLDRLAQQISALETRMTRLEQRPPPSAPDLGPLTARVTALEQRPAPAPDLTPLDQRITALEQRPAAPAATAPAPDLGPLAARVTALEQRPQPDISGLEGRIAAVAAKQQSDSQLAGRVAAVEAGQRSLQDSVTQRLGEDAARLAASEKTAAHLAQVQSVRLALDAGQKLGNVQGAPPALARYASANPPTEASLRLSFRPAARDALAASHPTADGKPLLTRLWAQAQDLVTIRQGDHVVVGDPAAGVLERAGNALDAGDLATAVAAVASLDGPAAQAMAPWLADARGLLDARAALATWAAHA